MFGEHIQPIGYDTDEAYSRGQSTLCCILTRRPFSACAALTEACCQGRLVCAHQLVSHQRVVV